MALNVLVREGVMIKKKKLVDNFQEIIDSGDFEIEGEVSMQDNHHQVWYITEDLLEESCIWKR